MRRLSDSMSFPKNVMILAGQLRQAYDYCKAESDALISAATMTPTVAQVDPAVTQATH